MPISRIAAHIGSELERVLRDQQHVADPVRAREVLAEHHHDHGEREARPHAGEDLRERGREARSAGSARALGMRYERAVSISVGSIARTPSIVFSSTGKMQKNAMNEIFWRVADRVQQDDRDRQQRRRRDRAPVLDVRHRRARGRCARGRAGSRSRRRGRPRSRSPTPIRSRLGTTCVLELREEPQVAGTRRGSSSARGNFGSSAGDACRAASATRSRIGTAISAAIFSVR